MLGKKSKSLPLENAEIESQQPDSLPESQEQTLTENMEWKSFSGPTIAAIDLISDKIREVSGLLEQSTNNVSQKFVRLAENSHLMTNTDSITEKVSTISLGDRDISINELAQILQTSLDKMLSQVQYITTESNNTLIALDAATNSLHEIEQFKTRMNAITKHANLLALNANIEATRSHDDGKGITIIADEIQKLSKEISQLSGEMNQGINHVTDSFKSSFSSLKNFAKQSSNDIDREEIDNLLLGLLGQKEELNRIFKSEAKISQNISADISSAIILQMQMQGFIKQNLNNSANVLDEIKNIIITYDKQKTKTNPSEPQEG